MALLDTPIRLLLVAIFTIALPLLCCCSAHAAADEAVEVMPVDPAGDHACCTTEPQAPEPSEQRPGEPCSCETHLETATGLRPEAIAVSALTPAAWLFDLPALPDILLLPSAPQAACFDYATADGDRATVAPTLRALSVLLTV